MAKFWRASIMRHRWWIALTALGVLTAVALLTMRMPKVYKATSTLEYDPNPSSPLGSSVEDPSVSHFLMSREFFETQNLIIQSRGVAERVVDKLGLAANPSFFGAEDDPDWVPVSKTAAAQRLLSQITVDPIKDTRLVRVSVRDQDPERAATLANAIVDAYVDKTMEDRLGSTVAAAEWLTQRLDSTQNQLDATEHALHDFKQEHNVLSVSLENRQSLVAEEIRAYNERLTGIRARRIELQARLQRLEQVKDDPQAIEGQGEQDDSELNALQRQLREKLTERAALSVRYGDSHPSIQELDQQIAALRDSVKVEVNSLIKIAKGDLREAQSIETGLSRAQNDAQKAGLNLNRQEIEYSRLNRQKESQSRLYELLLKRTAETDLARLLRTTHVRVVDRALVPGSPISPNVVLNLIGGLLGGLIAGFGLAFLLLMTDRRIEDVADVEQLGVTILGVFPRIRETLRKAGYSSKGEDAATLDPVLNANLFVHSHSMSAAAECCRTLRTNLTFMSVQSPLKSLVITSPNPEDGKTTVATNLAIVFAQSGKRVLLIDADLRRPRVADALDLPHAPGLTDALVGERSLEEVTHPCEVSNLHVVPSGPIPPNPAELLHTAQFERLLAEATEQYDRVIIDSPPLGAVTDAAILAHQSSGVLLVMRARVTTRDAILSAVRSLSEVQANMVGGVLNDVGSRNGRQGYLDERYHHYYRRHDYGPRSDGPSETEKQSAA